MEDFPHRRLIVIGTTSSGKSTLAARLAGRFQLAFIELDALYWGPNWTPARLEQFRARVETATSSGPALSGAKASWVVAGNYHVVRDLVWPAAEAVVWLDYSFPVVFWRLLTRTIRRGITGEELWNGNREKLWWHLKLWSEESLFHWLFKTYRRRKREYPILLALAEHRHLHVRHFRSPAETESWLSNLSRPLSKM